MVSTTTMPTKANDMTEAEAIAELTRINAEIRRMLDEMDARRPEIERSHARGEAMAAQNQALWEVVKQQVAEAVKG